MSVLNMLCIAGHDPSGGAGVQADQETALAHGLHPASVITALTRQDTHNAYAVRPVPDADFRGDLETLFADMRFAAIKCGLMGSPGQIQALADVLDNHPRLPLVVDPVLAAAGGGSLASDPVARALVDVAFPMARVITPNAGEARRLCNGETDLDRCGAQLTRHCEWVLITGGDEGDGDVINRLYGADGSRRSYPWSRLPHHYHGSGCTLASALAARLALGDAVHAAVDNAQDYAWQTLAHAFRPGAGQHVPNRLLDGLPGRPTGRRSP